MIGGGVIDWDYRGPIKIIIHNFTDNPTKHYNIGDSIAQLVILGPVYHHPMLEYNRMGLSETERGSSGFGSTTSNSTSF